MSLSGIPLDALDIDFAPVVVLEVEGFASLADLIDCSRSLREVSYFRQYPEELRKLRSEIDHFLASLMDPTVQGEEPASDPCELITNRQSDTDQSGMHPADGSHNNTSRPDQSRPRASQPGGSEDAKRSPGQRSRTRTRTGMSTSEGAPLKVLDLSTRAYNCLRRAGVCTVAELASLTDEQILNIRQVGVKTLAEIQEKLNLYLDEHPISEQTRVSEAHCEKPGSLLEKVPLWVFELPVDALDALRRAHIHTLGQLAEVSSQETLDIQSLDAGTWTEIRDRLRPYLAPLLSEQGTLSRPKTSPSDVAARRSDAPISEDTSIDVLELSVWPQSALTRAGIRTVGELARMSEQEILDVQGINERRLSEIEEKLQPYCQMIASEWSTLAEPATSIAVLGLSTRSHNALKRGGINSVDQLARMSSAEIQGIYNIGEKSLTEIEEKLEAYLAEHPEPETTQYPETSVSKSTIRWTSGLFDVPIDELGLSERTRRTLTRESFTTVGWLLHALRKRYLDIIDVGRYAFNEVKSKLVAYLAEHQAPSRWEGMQHHGLLIDAALLARANEIPLDSIPIKRLALPSRWEKQLHWAGIETVEELAWQSPSSFRRDCRVEKRLKRYLNWLVEQDKDVWADEVAGRGISPLHRIDLSGVSLDDLIENWLSSAEGFDDRDMQVIRWRCGLNGELLTLEEAGDRLGLSRERVRQLEKSALKHLGRPQNLEAIRPLTALLICLLENAGGLMNERQIEAALRDELVVDEVDPIGVAHLVLDITDDVRCICGGKAWGLEGVPLNEVEVIQKSLTKVLEEELVPLPVEEVISSLKGTAFYRNHQESLPGSFILACLKAHSEISIDEEGQCSLVQWESRRLDEMILALREIGEPVHYTKIAEKTNALLESEMQTSAHNIHAHMMRLPGIFVRVGHGVYGLAEWGLHDDGSLANAAHRVLSQANRPLHHDVIADRVLETWKARRSSVHVALNTDNRFVRIGPGVYWLRERIAEEGDAGGADFGELFGQRLEQWQEDLNAGKDSPGYDTHAEADAIRGIGLDFFE